ncbi:MAG: hypothetical protein QOI38_195 [Sphingomonadales bacterium]|jgi:hypothetical protein|nr:hypothetical protein [Sphingomonadales bacterium]
MVSYYRSGSELAVNNFVASNQTVPSVTYLPGGGFVITWETSDSSQDGSSGAIKGQVFDAAGAKVGAEFRVNTQAISNQYNAEVTALANGTFVVSWVDSNTAQDGSSSAIKAQLFSATGAKIGAEMLVNTVAAGAQLSPEVAGLAGGGFVISWSDANVGVTNVKAQIFSAAGAKVGTEFLVNNLTAAVQDRSDVAAFAGGGFVVTWRTTDSSQDGSGDAIKARLFAANGTPLGNEFLVNSQAAAFQFDPVVAVLVNGNFAISWLTADAAQDGSGMAVKAQIFDPAGAKIGAEFLVNTQASNNQDRAAITSLSSGGFMMAWASFDTLQDGSGAAVKAQVFDDAGGKVGAEFQINTLASGNQSLPQLAAMADGRVVATWSSDSGDGSGMAVRAQILAPNPAPVIVSDGGGSTAAVSVNEGQTAVSTVAATDQGGPAAVQYSISGGADAALFQIDGATGALAFAAAPDFETPADADVDNVYEVVVSAWDGELADTQAILVTVDDVEEGGGEGFGAVDGGAFASGSAVGDYSMQPYETLPPTASEFG